MPNISSMSNFVQQLGDFKEVLENTSEENKRLKMVVKYYEQQNRSIEELIKKDQPQEEKLQQIKTAIEWTQENIAGREDLC